MWAGVERKASALSVLGFAFLGLVPFSYSQSITVDGTTATSATTNANGSVTVDIAPAGAGGTSLNKYSDFNVGLPGVNLNNTTVGAQTIVNEVTSSRPSNINGALSVLGNQADVIIANPNGITVNGGSFNNTGNVGLVTGNLNIDAAGRVQSQVRGGQITIGSGGLSGTIEELDLIAKSISVNGNIQGATANSIASVNLFAGDSDVTFDGNRALPNFFPWADVTGAGGSNSGAVSVDITRPTTIGSGRIRIAVTDQGAGVRFAGNALASSGSFRITADGQLMTSGAEILSNGAVDIRAGEIQLTSNERQTQITSQTSGVVLESTQGNLDLGDSAIQGEIVSSANLASAGGITLISEGGVRLSSQSGEFDASLASNQSSLVIQAEGNVLLDQATITSGDEVLDSSGDDFRITTTGQTEILQSSIISNSDIELLSSDNLTVSSSQLSAVNNINVRASSATFDIDTNAIENTRTELVSEDAGVIIETNTGNFVNNGSLIQGADTAVGNPNADGAVTVVSAGDIINSSIDDDHLGVLFGEEDALSLQAAGNIINDNGRLFSNSDLRITAAHDFINQTRLTGNSEGLVIKSSKGSRLIETLFLKRKKNTSITGNFGDLAIDNELALVLAIGDVSIDADNIRNIGADISGTNLALDADTNFINTASLAGNISYIQKCRIFCRGSGTSNVSTIGGTLTGANNLNITAGVLIETRAGALVGNNNATFISPSIIASGLQVPLILERPSGLTGFFRGNRTWVSSNFTGAQINAVGGDLIFDGDVQFTGASLFTLGQQIITGQSTIVAEPEDGILLGREDLGLIGGLF